MSDKNLFFIATDDTNRALFSESLRAVCDSARRNGVRRETIADDLFLHVCSMQCDLNRIIDSERWIDQKIASLQRWRENRDEMMTVLKGFVDARKARRKAGLPEPD